MRAYTGMASDDQAHPIPPVNSPVRETCGRLNCQYLNPLRADLWCRACLVEYVQRKQNRAETHPDGQLYPDFDY